MSLLLLHHKQFTGNIRHHHRVAVFIYIVEHGQRPRIFWGARAGERGFLRSQDGYTRFLRTRFRISFSLNPCRLVGNGEKTIKTSQKIRGNKKIFKKFLSYKTFKIKACDVFLPKIFKFNSIKPIALVCNILYSIFKPS